MTVIFNNVICIWDFIEGTANWFLYRSLFNSYVFVMMPSQVHRVNLLDLLRLTHSDLHLLLSPPPFCPYSWRAIISIRAHAEYTWTLVEYAGTPGNMQTACSVPCRVVLGAWDEWLLFLWKRWGIVSQLMLK